MKITEEFIERGGTISNIETGAKSWTNSQIKLLGEIKSKGWKKRLIGKEISEDIAKKFLELNPNRCEINTNKISLKQEWNNLFDHIIKIKGEKFTRSVIEDIKNII